MTTQKSLYAGIVLIVVGVVLALRLWWLLPAALLVGGGVWFYTSRRSEGRLAEALQGLLWGVGLGVLYVISGFWLPGLLVIAGLSFLLRGREARVDAAISPYVNAVTRLFRARRRASAPVQHLSIETGAPAQYDQVRSGETRRL